MAKTNIIPEAINDFNLYLGGNKLIGITSEVSLAELSAVTQTVEGTGVLGSYDTAIVGAFDHISQEVPFRMINEDAMSMFRQDEMVDLTLRAAQQSTVKATGAIDFTGLRLVFRGRAESFSPGTIRKGGQTDSSVTLGLTYILIELQGVKLLELDKINGVYIVNGVDMLAKIKSLC